MLAGTSDPVSLETNAPFCCFGMAQIDLITVSDMSWARKNVAFTNHHATGFALVIDVMGGDKRHLKRHSIRRTKATGQRVNKREQQAITKETTSQKQS